MLVCLGFFFFVKLILLCRKRTLFSNSCNILMIFPVFSFCLCSFIFAALRCNCTNCEKTGYECETDGACMASTYYIDGKEKHVRICINSDKLVPPGQPFYCRSSEGVVNTHCCYEDYCNSIDLKVPGESWNHFIIFLFNQPDEFK